MKRHITQGSPTCWANGQLWRAALYHSPSHKLFAVKPSGVYLHPGYGECWWEQDHELAPCEIPVSTLHWETGFLDISASWDLSISWFLSVLIGICNALCTEMLGFFQQKVIHDQMKCLTVSSLAMPLLLSSQTASQRKSNTKLTEILLCAHLPIHTKKQSICKTLANKKIYSVIYIFREKPFVHPVCNVPENRKVFSPSWYSATPIKSETANFTLKPFKADGL